jgi:putative transposase
VTVRTATRRTIRLRDYDYTRGGAHFITICTRDRECLWGKVVNGMVLMNATKRLVKSVWLQTATVRPDKELDAHVVMPNHFHGFFFIHESPGVAGATRRVAPMKNHFVAAGKTRRPTGPKPRSLGAVMAQFKSSVTKRLNDTRQYRGVSMWQRNYYEHVIRDEESLNRIREYIATNAERWDLDRENLQAAGKDTFDDWLATCKSSPGTSQFAGKTNSDIG